MIERSPPSPLLRALTRYGKAADVALLARLGPTCALYVDTREHRAHSNDSTIANPFKLNPSEQFEFFCSHMKETNKAFPLANVAAAYAEHLSYAITLSVPLMLYLFMVAVETGVPGIDESIIHLWQSKPKEMAEETSWLARSFYKSELIHAYNMKPTNAEDTETREDCTIAEFLFGRSAHVGNLCTMMLTAPFFKRNINVHVLDQAMETIANQTKYIATTAAYDPTQVKRSVLDPSKDDDTKVWVCISDDARSAIERVAHRTPPRCVDWFGVLASEQEVINNIAAATHGDIVIGVSDERVRYVNECDAPTPKDDPPPPPAPAKAVDKSARIKTSSKKRAAIDDDEDVDDK